MNTVKSEVFSVKVIKKEVVAPNQPWHDHWLPFTNLDLLVPPIDTGSFFCYKKSQNDDDDDVSTMVDALKASLSQTLVSFYPFAGEIVHNAAGEPEIHCNNRGVDFIQAAADVDLRDLNIYDPQSFEGKLIPTRQHRLLAIQITTLKCGGMVIACMFDHRVADGYSALMFVSTWADINRSIQPSYYPSFRRSILNPRRPTLYSTSIANMYLPISDNLSSLRLQIDPKSESAAETDQLDSQLTSRIYYMEGEELKRLQSLASENKRQRSKLESFTSFLWKITASFLEDSGHDLGHMCKIAVAVDGRRRLSEGEGVEKQKLMATHFGNVLSIPFREIQSKDLKDMPLSVAANQVHDLLKSAATKDHFLELIDWVEDQRPKVLISRSFTTMKKGVSIMVSSGQGLSIVENTDFGWGKPVFGSCHLPSARTDCYVMTMESPINDDWVVYMHLPTKLLHYMETRAGHVFKPLTGDYLKLSV